MALVYRIYAVLCSALMHWTTKQYTENKSFTASSNVVWIIHTEYASSSLRLSLAKVPCPSINDPETRRGRCTDGFPGLMCCLSPVGRCSPRCCCPSAAGGTQPPFFLLALLMSGFEVQKRVKQPFCFCKRENFNWGLNFVSLNCCLHNVLC